MTASREKKPLHGGYTMPISELLFSARKFGPEFASETRSTDHLKHTARNAAHLHQSTAKVLDTFLKLAKGNDAPAVNFAVAWLSNLKLNLAEVADQARGALEIQIAARHTLRWLEPIERSGRRLGRAQRHALYLARALLGEREHGEPPRRR